MKSDFEKRRILNDPIATLPLNLGDELVTALRNALDLDMPVLFTDVVAWSRTALSFRDVAPVRITLALEAMRANVKGLVPMRWIEPARALIETALRDDHTEAIDDSAIDASTEAGARARAILDSLIADNDEMRASREALIAMATGMNIIDIYERVLAPVLHEAGRLWQRNEITVSQEHLITSAVERIMAQLIDMRSPMATRDLAVVSASVGSSQHEVGARMVADAFALCGWQSTYLGSNLPVEDVVHYVDSVSVDVLALSATLARDVTAIRSLIDELNTRPIAPVVIVGGRAFTLHPSLWRAIGADGCAPSPLAAVALAGELVHHCSE